MKYLIIRFVKIFPKVKSDYRKREDRRTQVRTGVASELRERKPCLPKWRLSVQDYRTVQSLLSGGAA